VSDNNFGDSDMGQMIGCAVIILALCLGLGGCAYLIRIGNAKVETAKHSTQEEKP
jgi:Ca2+/Na+ antiporter